MLACMHACPRKCPPPPPQVTDRCAPSHQPRPRQVREVVREKFAEAGWDVRTNAATRDEPPTLEELHAFLDGTIDALETFDPPVGELFMHTYDTVIYFWRLVLSFFLQRKWQHDVFFLIALGVVSLILSHDMVPALHPLDK